MTPAIVIGSGSTVWSDLRRHRAALEAGQAQAFAVNDMVVLSPYAHHGVSHHPDKLLHWAALRTMASFRRKRELGLQLHASAPHPGITHVWPNYRSGGSSSLLAVRVALAQGAPSVVVCGVPLDGEGYVWSDPLEPLPVRDFARYRQAWIDAQADLKGRVTAPSGFLADLLGETPAPAPKAAPGATTAPQEGVAA